MSARRSQALDTAFRVSVWAIPLTVAWTVAGVHIMIGTAALVALVRLLFARRWMIAPSRVDAPIVAFALACIVATIASPDRGASAYALRKLLLFFVIHFVVAAADTRPRLRSTLRCFVAGIALVALVSVAHFAAVHAPGARLRSTGHYMTLAGLLLLATPPCAAAAFATRGRRRAAYGAAAAVLLVALSLSFTRGAWLGVTAGLAAVVARARPRLALLVPAVVMLAFALAPAAYRQRALSSFDPHHPQNVDRLRLWRAAVRMIQDHPWTGVGLVDLKPYYIRYRDTTEGQVH